MIDFSIDADGIASITWNMAQYPMNVLNSASIAAFTEAVQRAADDPGVRGVIICSAKPDFVAGADLHMMLETKSPEAMTAFVAGMHRVLRHIETCGKPFVAAINGTALGGGYEISLACHRRIAADNPKALIGLPEVTLGIFPGGGGTQRLSRLIGVRAALPFLLEGRKVDPRQALENGLVDEVVAHDELTQRAKRWLLDEGAGHAVKPWDKTEFALPGGAIQSPQCREFFAVTNAMVRARTLGNYPAPLAILSCVYEGCQTDIDTGLQTEIRYFARLGTGPVAKNMIRTQFFAIGEAAKLAGRPKTVPAASFRTIGVLGAGMTGARIAHACVQAGIGVVLLDTDAARTQHSEAHSTALPDKAIATGRLAAAERDAGLALIRPTSDFADLADCELVIEAVSEERAIKAEVMRRAEAAMAPQAILASHTTTLVITDLAHPFRRPENVIGLHFSGHVEHSALVEIICGEHTQDECLARAMDFVRKLRKIPIVVKDSPGFYTTRVVSAYIAEACVLLAEGVNPALIENAGRHAGMPVGPLELADEVTLELVHHVQRQIGAGLGQAFYPAPIDTVAALLDEQLARTARESRQGFYHHIDGAKRLWPGLAEAFPRAPSQPDVEHVKRRLLTIQSIEALRCLEQGILSAPRDADVGAVLGWGFPAYLGGPVSLVHSMGIEHFSDQCASLAASHGERFAAPALLRDMAASSRQFYPV